MFYSLVVILLVVSASTSAFAQESLITVQTDDSHYVEEDTIVISGLIAIKIGNTPATLQLFSDGNLKDIAQITIAQDGSYSHTIIAKGPLWQKSGDYLVRASYGDGNIAEASFSYTPKSQVMSTTETFDVDAGSRGTFDVEYTIKGGTIKDISVDSEIFALVVMINATNEEGSVTLDLPREFIGAEKQNGKDEKFIVQIEGTAVKYEETVVLSESRVITIDFIHGDSKIEIIGTYVVPEFGAIVMVILTVGIMSIIIVTRKRLQITT